MCLSLTPSSLLPNNCNLFSVKEIQEHAGRLTFVDVALHGNVKFDFVVFCYNHLDQMSRFRLSSEASFPWKKMKEKTRGKRGKK